LWEAAACSNIGEIEAFRFTVNVVFPIAQQLLVAFWIGVQ